MARFENMKIILLPLRVFEGYERRFALARTLLFAYIYTAGAYLGNNITTRRAVASDRTRTANDLKVI